MIARHYRKRPVVIEAVQYDGSNVNDVVDWVDSSRLGGFVPAYTDAEGELHIATLEGDMHVSTGDWVIRGVQGEFYPCKPDVFADTYEAVIP